MSVTYDWSPVFQAMQGLGSRLMYQKALSAAMGGQNQTGVPQQPQQNPTALPTPPMTVNPGMIGGTQLPTQNIPSQPAPAPAPQMATPQAASNPYASMLPMLKYMDPSIGMPLLMQLQMKQAERQQNIQDRALTPMDPAEAKARGFKPGDVVYKDISGNPVVAEKSDMRSPGAVQQDEQLYTAENAYNPIPTTDPAYAGMKPGTILGRNALGAVKPLQESDMKSPGAMGQELQLVKAKEEADIAKQNALYGLGPGGQQQDFSKPLANNAFEQVAQSVANYDRSEATALSRYPAPVRAQIQARVSAINPNYNQPDYNAANAAKVAFSKGPQAQSIQSLNSTISHMDLMKKYVAALNNGDIQTVNALKNAVSAEFGGTAPTNAQAVAEILGPEMAKAVLPNGGTGPEREGFVNTLKLKASQGQLLGTLNTYQGLMAGQLLSLKKRYMSIPGHPQDFEGKFLLPETQQILAARPEYQGGVVTGNAPPPAPPSGKPPTVSNW